MGLLRACADVVLIGAGTFRAARGDRWTPAAIWPALAGLRAPRLAVVSASGAIDPAHPGLQDEVSILTTPEGAARLRGTLPPHVQVLTPPSLNVRELRKLWPTEVVLCEGGPTLISQFVAAGLLDELFLTLSPRLFGSAPGRKHLIEGLELQGAPLTLRSLRRSDSHLLLRYALR
jgi:riboflavin biosynthesis pyrimidine reductase